MIASMIDTLRYIWSHPLARHSRLEAFSRYFRWQFASRILSWPTVAPFVDGSTLVVERGMLGATGNIYCGLHEFVDMAFLLHYLRSEDLFVDIGANIGSYTVLASAVVGARSLSIEPIPDTFRLLERNIRVNNIGNLVSAICCALGKQHETRWMTSDCGTMNRIVPREYAGPSSEVTVQPLDELACGQPTGLWKVDVEGFELDVLEGAVDSIREPSLQALIIEGDSVAIRRILESNGFKLANYDPFQRELILSDAKPLSNNHLWIRNKQDITRRCKEGRSYTILSTTI